jgi:hypothetical protein
MAILTPVQYEQNYRNLSVKLDDGTVYYVDVHKYKNNASTTPGHETKTAQREAKDPLIAKLWAAAREEAGVKKLPDKFKVTVQGEVVDVHAVIRAFLGKGSPEDIALALRLAVRYDLVAAATNKLQAYCDKYIGVDCSGFVANYADDQLGKGFDVSNTKSTSFAPAATRRAEVDAIAANDAIVWATTNHVAIIDSLDEERIAWERRKSADPKLSSLVCTVVESNGRRGLGHCPYTVLSADAEHKVFKVKRQDDGHTFQVWISPL